MSISNSRLSYTDCYQLLDQAVEDSLGARVCLGTYEAANFFRMRCHQARAINRRDNQEMYELGDPKHGASVYDQVVLRLKEDEEGAFWVYAEKSTLDPGEIESLSELESTEYSLPKQIEKGFVLEHEAPEPSTPAIPTPIIRRPI